MLVVKLEYIFSAFYHFFPPFTLFPLFRLLPFFPPFTLFSAFYPFFRFSAFYSFFRLLTFFPLFRLLPFFPLFRLLPFFPFPFFRFRVLPLPPKVYPPNDLDNDFRQISVLPQIAKVLETLQLKLNKGDFKIKHNQHAFTNGTSTVSALASITHNWFNNRFP